MDLRSIPKGILRRLKKYEDVMSITATELRSHLDEYIVSSEKSPIIVETPEHKRSVLMSYTLYMRLLSLEEGNEKKSLRYETLETSETLSSGALLARKNLEHAYQQMAQDEIREADALEWAEAMIGDARQ